MSSATRIAQAAALLGLAACPTAARAGCTWPDLVRDDARAAVVRAGTARVHFVSNPALRAGCPQAGPRCARPSYVVPGDVVLTGHAEGTFTCAGFAGARGLTTIDFRPTASLSPLPAAQQAPGDWLGHWSAPEQDITIRPAPGGALAVAGDATWGMGDPARWINGGVHTGEVQGTTRPVDGVLAFT